MPSRRRFLTACRALAATAAVPGVAAGRQSSERDDRRDRSDATSGLDPAGTADIGPAIRSDLDPATIADAFDDLGDRVFGRVDLATARRLRDAAPSMDSEPRTDLDGRLAPVLGRGRDAPAGLRSLSGDLDPETAIRRIRRRAAVERLGDAGDHAVFAARTGSGSATLGTDGSDVLVDTGAGSVPATIPEANAGLGPAATAVVDGFRDAEAFTGATVAEGSGDVFRRGDPARAVRSDLAAFGLGVRAESGTPALEARLVASGDEPLSASQARALLAAVGVPSPLLADATVTTDGRVTVLRTTLSERGTAPVDRDGTQPALALLFLVVAVAVIGTFILGLGDSRTAQAPQVAFEFDQRADGRVTITHHGGDRLDDAQVVVAYTSGGETVTETWRDPDGISAGDTFTTSQAPDPGTEIAVTWHGESRTVLAEYEVPE